MLEVKIGPKTIDLPYTLRVYGVNEEIFDELVDEDTKAELIDGVMIVHSPASLQHEDVISFLGGLMGFYADAKGIGKVIASGNGVVQIAPGRKFAPDIFFIRQEYVVSPLPKEFPGVPDLVVEVLSASNRAEDLHIKRPAYREAGVKEIWFVDLDSHQVITDRRLEQNYAETIVTTDHLFSTVLAGFWIDVSWLWSEPLPNRMACLQQILRGR